MLLVMSCSIFILLSCFSIKHKEQVDDTEVKINETVNLLKYRQQRQKILEASPTGNTQLWLEIFSEAPFLAELMEFDFSITNDTDRLKVLEVLEEQYDGWVCLLIHYEKAGHPDYFISEDDTPEQVLELQINRKIKKVVWLQQMQKRFENVLCGETNKYLRILQKAPFSDKISEFDLSITNEHDRVNVLSELDNQYDTLIEQILYYKKVLDRDIFMQVLRKNNSASLIQNDKNQ